MNQESKSRAFCVAGIVLACGAYLVFMPTGSHWAFVIAAVGFACSFWGLWSWHRYQVRSREP